MAVSQRFIIAMALQCAVAPALLWSSKSTKAGCEMLDPFLSQADVSKLSNYGRKDLIAGCARSVRPYACGLAMMYRSSRATAFLGLSMRV